MPTPAFYRLSAGGAAVLLHHPRKGPTDLGSMARGSGALLGFVDVTVELTRYSQLGTDANRRLLTAEGRRPGVPARLADELDPATGAFRAVGDPGERQFAENWTVVARLLRGCRGAVTCRELLPDWPAEVPPPESTLYHWLALAEATGLAVREGRGTRDRPWRYRLPYAGVGGWGERAAAVVGLGVMCLCLPVRSDRAGLSENVFDETHCRRGGKRLGFVVFVAVRPVADAFDQYPLALPPFHRGGHPNTFR